MNKQDTIFSQPLAKVTDFKFDSKVVDVFDNMIKRSVPGYGQLIRLTSTITRQFIKPEHNYYDLGCSLGAGMLAMADALQNTNCTLIGVDNSEAMITQAKQNYADSPYSKDKNIKPYFLETDITQYTLDKAAMVLMNYTLQFIAIDKRQSIIQSIYDAILPGGAFILSEKIKFDDQYAHQALTQIHHQFKADQGYSQLEISQKRDSIENVLIPETLETHITRLRQAGFSTVTPWLQNFQFISIIAIK